MTFDTSIALFRYGFVGNGFIINEQFGEAELIVAAQGLIDVFLQFLHLKTVMILHHKPAISNLLIILC
jgi:hypothetical protein